MLTLELPVLVSVTVCMALLPTVTLPKLRLAGLAVSCGVSATPVPLIAMLRRKDTTRTRISPDCPPPERVAPLIVPLLVCRFSPLALPFAGSSMSFWPSIHGVLINLRLRKWNDGGNLIRVRTLDIARIDGRDYIEVGLTRLNRAIGIGGQCDQRGIQFRVRPARYGSAVYVVASHYRRAGRPTQSSRVRNQLHTSSRQRNGGGRVGGIAHHTDTASCAAANRWRELYINAAGLTGRKRDGEGLPGHCEARSSDRSLGDGQAARTRVAKDDGLLATGSNPNTPEGHAARSSAQLASCGGGWRGLATKARAARHRDQTKQRTHPVPCAGVSSQRILSSWDARCLRLVGRITGQQYPAALLVRLAHKSSLRL